MRPVPTLDPCEKTEVGILGKRRSGKSMTWASSKARMWNPVCLAPSLDTPQNFLKLAEVREAFPKFVCCWMQRLERGLNAES